jgi:DNA-binding NtrC family response regulator
MVADNGQREKASEILKAAGYAVLVAKEGREALHWLERDAGKIDVLFTDAVLPGEVQGRDLVGRGRAKRPGLAVAYTSCLSEWFMRPPPDQEVHDWLAGLALPRGTNYRRRAGGR